MPFGKPDGPISLAYNIMYDPEINKDFVTNSSTVINAFLPGSGLVNIRNALTNAGAAAGPLADPNMPTIRDTVFAEIRQKFQNVGPFQNSPDPGAKPKSPLSFIYNVIYDPVFRNNFNVDPIRTMDFFALAGALRVSLSLLWNLARQNPPPPQALIDHHLGTIKLHVDNELDGNYPITW